MRCSDTVREGVIPSFSHRPERGSHDVFDVIQCNAALVLGVYGWWRICHVSEACPQRRGFRISKGRDEAKSQVTLVLELLWS